MGLEFHFASIGSELEFQFFGKPCTFRRKDFARVKFHQISKMEFLLVLQIGILVCYQEKNVYREVRDQKLADSLLDSLVSHTKTCFQTFWKKRLFTTEIS